MSPTTFDIRRAATADVERIAPLFDLYRQFYGQPGDVAAAGSFLRERLECAESVVFVAEEDGRALGFTQLYPSFSSVALKPLWILNDLFVASEARGRGIGAALLEAARQHAVETGARGLELATGIENVTAQRLYERCGWQRERDFVRYGLRV